MNKRDMVDELEEMIDQANVSVVIGRLAEICALKSEHIAETWQDKQLARDWNRAASKLSACATALRKEGL